MIYFGGDGVGYGVNSKRHLTSTKKGLGDNLLTQQSERRIHVSHSLPLVAGESVIQKGNIFGVEDIITTEYGWSEATRVECSILTVIISTKCNDNYFYLTEM